MSYIIGVDECGYGSYAGPLCVASVRAPHDWNMDGLNDSKKLSTETRAQLNKRLFELIDSGIIKYNLQLSNNDQIDNLGLGVCHRTGIANSINALYTNQEEVIIDGNLAIHHFLKYGLKSDTARTKSIVKADSKYPTVMAASIIAKNYRDNLMKECHKSFNYYGWDQNVGYIVPAHILGIKKYGLSCLHRKSYKVKLN